MYPRVATCYDQNPARIKLVVRKNRNHHKKQTAHLFGMMIALAICTTYAAGFLFA